MTCISCKGDLVDKNTNFIVDLSDRTIIVRDIPSQVCSQCGKVSYSHEVAKRLEKLCGLHHEVVPEPEEVAAILEGRADRAEHGTVSHDAIDWD